MNNHLWIFLIIIIVIFSLLLLIIFVKNTRASRSVKILMVACFSAVLILGGVLAFSGGGGNVSIVYGKYSAVEALGTATADKSATAIEDPDQIVYYTENSEVYHLSRDCSALKNAKVVLSGTIKEARKAGKTRPCKLCGADD